MAVSFIGGGNRNTHRKTPICRRSLLGQTLSHNVVSSISRHARYDSYTIILCCPCYNYAEICPKVRRHNARPEV